MSCCAGRAVTVASGKLCQLELYCGDETEKFCQDTGLPLARVRPEVHLGEILVGKRNKFEE